MANLLAQEKNPTPIKETGNETEQDRQSLQ